MPQCGRSAPCGPGLEPLLSTLWPWCVGSWAVILKDRYDQAPCSKGKSQHVAFWKSRFVDNGHRNSGFTWIYPLKIVIFHSYVSLPEGGTPKPVGPDLALISMGICWGTTPTSTRAVSCSSAWTTNIHLTQESPPLSQRVKVRILEILSLA